MFIIDDLYDNIVLFINNFKDYMTWRHICKSTYKTYEVLFYCSNMYSFIKTPYVKLTNDTNLGLLIKRNYIKKLVVSSTNINDEHLLNLTNLTYLEFMTYNKLYLTSIGFSNLINLKTLICPNSSYSDDIFYKLKNLTYLDCSNCFHIIGYGITLLPNLIYLKCNNNPYMDLTCISSLLKLKTLITDKHIYDHDQFITCLKNSTQLKFLDILGCGIRPNIMKSLCNLQFVNCLDYIYEDDHIINNTKIKTIICGQNTKLTNNLFIKLTNLEVLKINGHVNISIDTFKLFKNLYVLNCGHNQIEDNVFKYLPTLITLECENNISMTDLGLQYLTNLTELNCGKNNNITNNGVLKLLKLKILSCGNNKNITDKILLHLNLISLSCGYNCNFKNGLYLSSLRHINWYTKSDIEINHNIFIDIIKKIKLNIDR